MQKDSGGRWRAAARHRAAPRVAGCLLGLSACWLPAAEAGRADFYGIDLAYSLKASYAAAWRLEDPDPRIIDTPGSPEVPVAEFLKYPESSNYDDGNRNFDQWAMVNNRASLLGDLDFSWRDYGFLIRGDAFYDHAYAGRNDHDSPDSINTSQEPFNTFTDAAESRSHRRARLLDAYVYGNFYFGDTMALNVRVGRHIAAWGESLFFSGIAQAQAPADATRATVPGIDVKSILLPVNQASFRFTLTRRLTLLGQYIFDFKPFEVDPIGSFYSPSDVVGPGAEMIYGLKNPLNTENLAELDITDPEQIAGLVMTIDEALFDNQLPTEALENLLVSLPLDGLPPIRLPLGGANSVLDAPEGLNPTFAGYIESDDPEYGAGLKYQLTPVTELGAYYLRYHQKTPAVVTNFGELDIIPEQEIAGATIVPAITTADLGINVPATYNIRYFDNVDLYAMSLSTLIGGVNVAAEVIHRRGVDVNVDVPNGVNGPVPTPTRANTNQVLINAIYSGRPPWLFDSLSLVGEIGWVEATDVQAQPSQEGDTEGEYFKELQFDRQAWAVSVLAILQRFSVFPGWDLTVPVSYQQALEGRSPLNGGFGSLFDENDTRLGIGVDFTRQQRLTIGFQYSGFLGGSPHFLDRPLADRDTIGLSVEYDFF